MSDESERAPKLIGFVHSSDSDPRLLLNLTRELLELIRAGAGRRAPKPAGDRWLVVMSARTISCLEAYRYIYSQLRIATGFKDSLGVWRWPRRNLDGMKAVQGASLGWRYGIAFPTDRGVRRLWEERRGMKRYILATSRATVSSRRRDGPEVAGSGAVFAHSCH